MLRFKLIFPTLFVALLLSACGGPDPKQILSDARVQFSAAGAAVRSGDWTTVRTSWLAGSALIDSNDGLMVDGQTLDQHRNQALVDLQAQLTAAMPRLLGEAERDRATWTAVQDLITTCGSAQLHDAWNREGKAISDRLDAAVVAAQRAAEAAQRARRSQAYVCWVLAGSESKQSEVVQWRKALAEQLSKAFAPVEVVMIDAKPALREGLGSIAIQLQWNHVAYGGGIGAGIGVAFDSDKVPVQLDATMTVATWVKPGSRDGAQSWHFVKEAPDKVGQYGVSLLADKNRQALLAELDKALAALPPLVDGAGLVEAAKAYAPPQPQAIWAYTVTSRTRGDLKDNPVGLHGFASVGKELAEVLADQWGIIDLQDAASKPAASGTVSIAIETFEETFGRRGQMLNTANGTIPTSMQVTLTISPAPGTTVNWPTTTTWTAREPAPATVDANNLDAQVLRNRQALTKQLVAKIQAEPKLKLERRSAP